MIERGDEEVSMSFSACFTRALCMNQPGCNINQSTAIIASVALEELGLGDGDHCEGTLSCNGTIRDMTGPEQQKALYLELSPDQPICNVRLTLFQNMDLNEK
jgi:hypothetical protein